MNALRELMDSRDLLLNLTMRELRGKYKRTVLGHAWSLVNPLAQMAIFSAVFGFVLRTPVAPGAPSGLDIFALWLTAALLPWIFFANVVNTGMVSLVANSNLLKKVYFSRQTLVTSNALSWLITFCIEMAVLTVVLIAFGGTPYLYLPLVFVTMVLLALFALGLSFMLAVANVYFRDTQHLVSIVMQIWFYASPIVYPATLIEQKDVAHPSWHLLTIYRANPIERFFEVFRSLLYDNTWPALSNMVFITVVSLASVVVGFMVFQRFAGGLAEEL